MSKKQLSTRKTTFFLDEISYESDGVRFDQEKVFQGKKTQSRGLFYIHQITNQFHRIKNYQELSLKTQETIFLCRKLEKSEKIVRNFFRKLFNTSVSRIVPKKLKWSSILAKRCVSAENRGRGLGLKI